MKAWIFLRNISTENANCNGFMSLLEQIRLSNRKKSFLSAQDHHAEENP